MKKKFKKALCKFLYKIGLRKLVERVSPSIACAMWCSQLYKEFHKVMNKEAKK